MLNKIKIAAKSAHARQNLPISFGNKCPIKKGDRGRPFEIIFETISGTKTKQFAKTDLQLTKLEHPIVA